jgi:hypothetical protein
MSYLASMPVTSMSSVYNPWQTGCGGPRSLGGGSLATVGIVLPSIAGGVVCYVVCFVVCCVLEFI